jgi:putative ABC transport system permease protein
MRWLMPIGRLRPGRSVEQATAELSAISRHLEELEPATEADWGVKVKTLQDAFYSSGTPRLFLYLLGAVSFVLLIACANVANLLLARAAVRRKEIAVRASLGAGRMRLLRQLLTESVVLALVGGALGVIVAGWGIDIFLALAPVERSGLPGIDIDVNVLAYTLGISLFTGILFGLAPALQASRPDLNETLKESGGRAFGVSRQRTRTVLVVTEIALALVLLIGAGLMINSLLRLGRVDLGFNPKNLLTAKITPDGPKYLLKLQNDFKRLTPQGDELVRQLLERLQALPAVEAAAVRPIGPRGLAFRIAGRPAQEKGQYALYSGVSPGYFRALEVPLLRGRLLTGRDAEQSPWVVVINQAMAKRFFPDEDPIGKELQLTISASGMSTVEDRTRQIVGIVGDIKQFGPMSQAPPAMYGSYRQHISDYPAGSYVSHLSRQVMIRTSSNPMKLAGPLQQIVAGLDKDLAVFDVKTMEEALADSLSYYSFMIRLFGIFGGLALLLAAVGIYGVMSYSVAQRTHEIGVRLALGAQTSDVLKIILRQGLKLTLIGVAIGIAGSLALTRLISRMLFGVKATDPLTYAIVSLILTAIALLACYIPARRATKVDPMVALRYE